MRPASFVREGKANRHYRPFYILLREISGRVAINALWKWASNWNVRYFKSLNGHSNSFGKPMLLLYLFENLQFAGHCYQAVKELILFLILWYPVGRVHSCKLTYPNLIARVSGLDTWELSTVMVNVDFLGRNLQECPFYSCGWRMIMIMMMMMYFF